MKGLNIVVGAGMVVLAISLAVVAGINLQPERPQVFAAEWDHNAIISDRAIADKCQPKPDAVTRQPTETANQEKECRAQQQAKTDLANVEAAARQAARVADENLKLSFEQARAAAWATALGFSTLITAIAAALFAQRAAHHTRRTADSALAVSRPWLSIDLDLLETAGFSPPQVIRYGEGGAWISLKIKLHNHGSVPATKVRTFVDVQMGAGSALLNSFPSSYNELRTLKEAYPERELERAVFPGSTAETEFGVLIKESANFLARFTNYERVRVFVLVAYLNGSTWVETTTGMVVSPNHLFKNASHEGNVQRLFVTLNRHLNSQHAS